MQNHPKKHYNITMKKIAFIIAISIIIPLKCYAIIGMNNELNEKEVFIKVRSGFLGRDIKLETTIYKPNGNGPFPLFVLIPQKQKGNPANQPRARYVNFSAELVNRGYAVAIPMPKGYSNSSGQFDQKNCEIRKIAEEQSNDVNHVIKFLNTLDFIDQNQVIMSGHS
jgi:dipeptidyl aminopeptidase/acylaminoacyl peptidase